MSRLKRQPKSPGGSGPQRELRDAEGPGLCQLAPASVTPAFSGACRVLSALLYLRSRSGHSASAYRAVQRLFAPVTRWLQLPRLRSQHRSQSQSSSHRLLSSAARLQSGLRQPPPSHSPAFCTARQQTGASSLGDYVESHCKAESVQSEDPPRWFPSEL